jgi:hypothetical protein
VGRVTGNTPEKKIASLVKILLLNGEDAPSA